jgi:hypothetical protein
MVRAVAPIRYRNPVFGRFGGGSRRASGVPRRIGAGVGVSPACPGGVLAYWGVAGRTWAYPGVPPKSQALDVSLFFGRGPKGAPTPGRPPGSRAHGHGPSRVAALALVVIYNEKDRELILHCAIFRCAGQGGLRARAPGGAYDFMREFAHPNCAHLRPQPPAQGSKSASASAASSVFRRRRADQQRVQALARRPVQAGIPSLAC